jgi:5-aminolevulinate synthase
MNELYQQIFSDKLNHLKQRGNYRYFQDVNKSAKHFPRFYFDNELGEKKSATNWCSNDYLCMSIHEDVISKFSFTAHHSGVGSSGTRNISGTTGYHQQLEKLIGELHNKESALIFNSAYIANLSSLATLGRAIPNAIFISDERNHASIIEGIRSSGNKKIVFNHNDTTHLEKILSSLPLELPKIIAFESVYSIHGHLAPIREIVALAKRYNALTYVDEVHAVGLYSQHGAGLAAAENLQYEVDFINGTFAKAFGTIGGYVAADNMIVDFLRSFSSGFIFTTSLPPAICSATIKSIELVKQNNQWREQFHQSVIQLRKAFDSYGIAYPANTSHITTVTIGDSSKCKWIADKLLIDFGVYLQPINPPTVRDGEACLRVTVTAKHTPAQIEHLAASLSTLLHEKV